MRMPTLLLLGSGELGKEVAISAKRLGCRVVAVDSYAGAPAMQVSDAFEVISMLDGEAVERVVRKHLLPRREGGRGKGSSRTRGSADGVVAMEGFIVPEIEAIRTERLLELERVGFSVVPSARAAHVTMNRDAIRDLAATKLRLPTAKFAYAESEEELRAAILGDGESGDAVGKRSKLGAARGVNGAGMGLGGVGLPCVVKPVMSSSGKGQSVVRTKADVAKAWAYACAGRRGDTNRVIAEEFIDFDYEITLLTVRQRPVVAGKVVPKGKRTIFVRPIGHRQERGDYQESWMPCAMKPALVKKAQAMARAITEEIAGEEGAGLFGVEFFVRGDEVIFSELSPRPHDTGMVTMISQDLSEFDLHVRAILGLPIPAIRYAGGAKGGSASAVILSMQEGGVGSGQLAVRKSGNAKMEGPVIEYPGLDRAMALKDVQVRIFGKPTLRKYRRMGVALAVVERGGAEAARRLAKKAAGMVGVVGGRERN